MSLHPSEIARIKELIWEGASYEGIADEFSITTSAISKITHGRLHPLIPWPDNTIGPISQEQLIELRRRKHARRLSKIPSIQVAEEYDPFVERMRTLARQSILGERTLPTPEELEGTTMSEAASDTLETKAGEIAQEMESDLTDVMTTAEEDDYEGESPAQLIREKYDWEKLSKVAVKHPLVKQATEEEDEWLKLAICILFKELPTNQWFGPTVSRMAFNIREQLISEDEG
jgi:hypothetical protein